MVVYREWLEAYWGQAVRTVHHAASHRLLVLVEDLLLGGLGDLLHVLEVQEAIEGVSIGLLLVHFECLLVLVAVAVHWARPDHHLRREVALGLHEVLVLHVIELLLMHHVFVLCVQVLLRSVELLVHRLLRRSVPLAVNVLRLNLKIFLFFLVLIAPGRGPEEALVVSGDAVVEVALERVDFAVVVEVDGMLVELG